MKMLFTFIACFFLILDTANAQSFFKRKNKYHREYMATARTGAVDQKLKPGASPEMQAAYMDDSRASNANVSQRALRKEARKQAKAQRQAARIAKHLSDTKYKEEKQVLGDQLAAKEAAPSRGYGR